MSSLAIAVPGKQLTPDPGRHMPHLPVLDGWRGLSIILVLACHTFPVGRPEWQLNFAVGVLGMAIFFALSGFLIVSTLYVEPSVRKFVVRRAVRILPVAWLFMLITLPGLHISKHAWCAYLLFYANVPPIPLVPVTGHLWSLCVEVQFYVAIGLLFWILRQKAFILLPITCIAVTAFRIAHHAPHEIETFYRVDEILSGATLAWLFHSKHSRWLRQLLERLPPTVPIVLLCLSSMLQIPWLNYPRPYFAALAVGTTLYQPHSRWARFFRARILAYLAAISYALYVWHPFLRYSPYWHDAYLARAVGGELVLPIALFIAYCSTNYFERPWINLGKRLLGAQRSPKALAP